MQINRISVSQENTNNKKYQLSNKGAREIVRTLADQDALASTILLETAVTGGRGYNAYKRSGAAELRERAFDDIVSAVFWMKGVDIFNNIGDKIGTHVLKLPTTEFDVGKDALRTPFNNLVGDLSEKVKDTDTLKKLEKKLAVFKFSKIILSTLLATGFVGFALPKINQAITRKLMHIGNNSQSKNVNNDDKYAQFASVSFDEFNKKFSSQEKPAFKGISPNAITTVAHYLEGNKICKLLSSDVGILAGRVTTARNKDEGLEYLFRDTASSFFYIASTPIIYSLLQKATGSAKSTSIDTVAAKQVYNMCLEQIRNADGTFGSIGVREFAAKTIGILDDKAKELLTKLPFNSDVISLTELSKHITDEILLKKADGTFGSIGVKEFAEKIIGKLDDKAIELLSKLPFDSDVIPLSELSKYLTDETLIKKAAELSKLQPKQAGVGAVLTRQQVADVLKNGAISEPSFMQRIFKTKFGEALTNPYKFIPMKKITKFRDNIDDYAKAVIDFANKTNNGVVDKKLLDKLSKRSFIMSAGFRAIAIGISAFALGIAIPKIQYAITAKRTGSTKAPGLREFEQSESKKV